MGGVLLPFLGLLSQQQPDIIPNLEVWYNADIANSTNFGQNIPSNGTGVKTWVDRATNLHNADQSVRRQQPTWNSNQLNGLGVIRFDGDSDLLSINPIVFLRNLPGVTMYIVSKALLLEETPVMITSDNSDEQGFRFSWDNTWRTGAGGGTAISSVPGDTTNFHIFGQIFNGNFNSANLTLQNQGRLKFRYDGVEQPLTYTANVGTATATTGSNIYIGGDATTDPSFGINFMNCEIAEIFIFTRALTEIECISVENYLREHWGI
jgi:hypothetical protein